MYSKDSHRVVFQKLMPHTAAYKDSVMLFATITAVAIHAAVIFGIQFEDKSSPTAAVQEVTTVLTENLQKNEKADLSPMPASKVAVSPTKSYGLKTIPSVP